MLENQHKLIQLLRQNNVRFCSSGSARLQEATRYDEEDLLQHFKPADEQNFYYPTAQPFKHNPDIGDQFKVRKSTDLNDEMANDTFMEKVQNLQINLHFLKSNDDVNFFFRNFEILNRFKFYVNFVQLNV